MMKSLEDRVAAIEARNKKVELDKAWEVSWARRISIAILTYVVIAIFLIVIDKPQPFINAFVPAIGFLLSTLAMKELKNVWQDKMRARISRKKG